MRCIGGDVLGLEVGSSGVSGCSRLGSAIDRPSGSSCCRLDVVAVALLGCLVGMGCRRLELARAMYVGIRASE